ncbi:MAG: ATP-binding protein [Halobacteriales archaeon]
MAELPDFEDVTRRFEEVDVDVAWTEGLGYVTASDGISVGRDPRVTAYVTVESRSDVRVGSYYVVPYPDGEHLFARIASLRYEQQFDSDDANEVHAQRALSGEAIDENDFKLLAELEPIAVLYEDDGVKRRMTDRVPKPSAVVEPPGDRAQVKAGLDIPEHGVFVGHLAVGGERVRLPSESPPTVDYRLDDGDGDREPLIFRHLLVAGGTGSGKSHNAKNILRQLVESTYEVDVGDDTVSRKPALVVIDPQNEYASLHDDPDVDRDTRREWEAEGIHHGGHPETTAFVPDVEGYDYDAGHRAPQREFSVPFEMVRYNHWLLAGGALNENQLRGLERLLDDYFDGADQPTYDGFSRFLDDTERRERYDERGLIHEATYDALVSRIAENPVFERVFDRPADPITDPGLLGRLVRPGAVSVIPTYHVSSSRAEEVVVLAVASLLVDDKLRTGGRRQIKETPLVLALDEAHNFLGDAETAQGRIIQSKFSDAAKQGRKERLGLFLVTQDPGDVADAVFKQINTKIALNLGDEQALSSLNLPTELENRVPYLERGRMAVYSPDNSEPVEVAGLPDCVVQHD